MIKRNQTIVVTGAAGLVGSAVVERLRSELYTCVLPLMRSQLDLTDTKLTKEWFKFIRPQHVFHSAATVYGLGGNSANQGKAIYDNTLINTNVIEACREAGSVRKLTVMGTNAIYPADAPTPWTEADIFNGRPHDGEAGYGHAKRHMLAMLEAYHQSYGLQYSYLVSGNIYGPRDRFDPINGHVIPSLLQKFRTALSTGGTVEIWGNGEPRRDFLYSKDLARIVQLLMSEDIRPGPINIGSGNLVSIRQAVENICRVTGLSPDRVKWDADKPNGRLNCAVDLRRIQTLGFIPHYDLETGLRETWEWYRANG